MIAIIAAGSGNYGAIQNMFKKIGFDAKVTSCPDEIESADKLVLPGVGAYDEGMRKLSELRLINSLRRKVLEECTPILGICLGMQLLTEGSAEGKLPGLAFIRARSHCFNSSEIGLKVPHMGWNTVNVCKAGSLFDFPSDLEQRFYFVHSYYVVCEKKEDVLGTTEYGAQFASAFQNKNIYGVQFHPEKSHSFGMNLLQRFAEI